MYKNLAKLDSETDYNMVSAYFTAFSMCTNSSFLKIWQWWYILGFPTKTFIACLCVDSRDFIVVLQAEVQLVIQ